MVVIKCSAFKSIHSGDMIVLGARFWRVSGVYLGGSGQESLIGIECLDRHYGYAGGHGSVREMLVPIDLIPYESIFRQVDHAEAEKGKTLVAVA